MLVFFFKYCCYLKDIKLGVSEHIFNQVWNYQVGGFWNSSSIKQHDGISKNLYWLVAGVFIDLT